MTNGETEKTFEDIRLKRVMLSHFAVALLSCLVTTLVLQLYQPSPSPSPSKHRNLIEANPSSALPTFTFTSSSSCVTHPLVTSQMISQLYAEKVVKSSEYYSLRTNITYWADFLLTNYSLDTSIRDMARLWPILDFHDWVHKYGLSTPKKLLSTFYNDAELRFIKHRKKIEYKFSAGRKTGDLHTLGTNETSMQQKDFDLVIISQTFEHLYDPYLCALNIFHILAPGGYFYTSAPAQNIPHMTPIHFQHFRPSGFVLLFLRAGFEIIEYGEWGNQEYEKIVLGTHKWPNYRAFQTLTNRENLDYLKNDAATNPFQMWILVRKPLQSLE
jgi:SAM-dependent methyltransferase